MEKEKILSVNFLMKGKMRKETLYLSYSVSVKSRWSKLEERNEMTLKNILRDRDILIESRSF